MMTMITGGTYNERCVIFPPPYHRENSIYKQPLEDEIRIWLKETGPPVMIVSIFKNITCSPISRELYSITMIQSNVLALYSEFIKLF